MHNLRKHRHYRNTSQCVMNNEKNKQGGRIEYTSDDEEERIYRAER